MTNESVSLYVFEGKSIIQRAYKIIRIRLYLGNRGGTFRLRWNWFVSKKYCTTKAKLIIAFCSPLLSEIPSKLAYDIFETSWDYLQTSIKQHWAHRKIPLLKHWRKPIKQAAVFENELILCVFREANLIGLMSMRLWQAKLQSSPGVLAKKSNQAMNLHFNHKNTILFIFCLSSIEIHELKEARV